MTPLANEATRLDCARSSQGSRSAKDFFAEASKALGISPFTGRTHVKNMFVKLNCMRQFELIRIVIEHPAWLLLNGMP